MSGMCEAGAVSARRSVKAAVLVLVAIQVVGGCAKDRETWGGAAPGTALNPPGGAGPDDGGAAPATLPEPEWEVGFDRYPSVVGADGAGAVVLVGFRDVVAIDRSGDVAWTARVPGAGYVDPALDPDLVLVGANDGFGVGSRGEVVALDRTTGSEVWRARGDPVTALALGVDLAYVLDVTGRITAYDLAGGEPVWSSRPAGDPAGVLALAREVGVVAAVGVGAGGTSTLLAVDARTGADLWEVPLEGPGWPSAPGAAGGSIVVGDGTDLRAFDPGTGSEAWVETVPAGFDPSVAPVEVGGLVVIADAKGALRAFDAATGEVAWATGPGAPAMGSPVAGASAVWAATWGGEVVGVDPSTGEERWRAKPSGMPVSVAVTGDRVLVSLRLTDPGRVEAYAPG